MKNFKLTRNIWIAAGVCSLIATILQSASKQSTQVQVLNGVTCILFFINAYINHKKIAKENRD